MISQKSDFQNQSINFTFSQVHIAYKDDQKFAVKIQYPHLKNQVHSDLSSLFILSRMVELLFPKLNYSWVVPEFKKSITLELDFMFFYNLI